MVADNEPVGARYGDICRFLQPFGHCKREATILCGQVCHNGGGRPSLGKGVGWHWAVRRWRLFEATLL